MASLFALRAKNEQQSQTLAALRDAILPKLLSGEIRVKQAEKIVGEAV
jgi:type I restriction enzyme S subunit